MTPEAVRRSKRLSLVLRHRPASVGLELDPAGWVGVDELLAALARRGGAMSRDQFDEVVATNDKQRFEWDRDGDRIRARQGHSVEVELDLPLAVPPEVLFHGTPTRNLDSILATGLDRRRRHHVHLSPDEETARRVGARRGEAVVLVVEAARMHAEGHRFRVSGNGVWLVDAVPPAHLRLL